MTLFATGLSSSGTVDIGLDMSRFCFQLPCLRAKFCRIWGLGSRKVRSRLKGSFLGRVSSRFPKSRFQRCLWMKCWILFIFSKCFPWLYGSGTGTKSMLVVSWQSHFGASSTIWLKSHETCGVCVNWLISAVPSTCSETELSFKESPTISCLGTSSKFLTTKSCPAIWFYYKDSA